MELPLRDLGSTGLRVTPVCAGTAGLGSMPDAFGFSVPQDVALDTVRAILDSPIRFLDTSAAYGDGESERRIGIVLRKRGGLPPQFVLATKADRDLATGDFSGDQMKRSIERSLRLLGLDRLQLVYLHDPEHTTFEEAMAPGGPVEVLRRYRDEGVIEHLGVAGGPIPMMIRYVETDLFEVAISHNRYTLLNRTADDFWNVCSRHGVAAVNAAPYNSGILAAGPDAYPRYAYQDAGEEILDRARSIEAICARWGVPLAAAALQFSLRDPRITSTIAGLTSPEQVEQTLDFASYPIPDEAWKEIEAVPSATGDPESGRFK